ncbi:MAG TPA: DUF3619 family protein [Caldimonas sp.]|nr:DUF3619 family protein [Caldimonas sp.]
MNTLESTYRTAAREAIEARFARGVVARLSEQADHVSPEVGERLRFARQKALEAAQRARASGAVEAAGRSGRSATAGFARASWWLRVASVLPLVALVGGLVLIQESQTRSQITTAAQVDTELLGDDLPLNAYRDAGFVEFLKTPDSE